MTMGDENLFASMTMPVILIPILEQLERRDMAAAQALRAAFKKVETEHPGFAYDLVKGVLKKAEVQGQVDMTEAMLRMEGMHNAEELLISRTEEPFRELNQRATGLKKILSRIPDEIYDRRRFLETIKEIAGAIKYLLDSVNSVANYIEGQGNQQALEQRKREFVRCSKRFSNTLKEFFKDSLHQDVFLSGCHLINQTNLILKTVKDIS
eukprot:GHVT01000502.1.p1 GENE.GHVT01000502.1~~GHVT01000502.1.p1  ORF type:complete len:209 (+),score=5.48 GHVT01000502.1:444-1070(+)